MALVNDFVLLAALTIVYFNIKSKILFILISIIAYFIWKNLGGINNWKLSTIKRFLINWDKINLK
jgi:hypothetical protein